VIHTTTPPTRATARRLLFAPLLLTAVAAGGCGQGNVKELQAPRQGLKVSGLAVVQEPAAAVVPAADSSVFRQRLTASLRDAGFEVGSGMTLSYRFVEYTAVNRNGGLLAGVGVGRGTATVEVTYTREGETVAVTRVTGNVGDERADDLGGIAKRIADYTRRNFKQ